MKGWLSTVFVALGAVGALAQTAPKFDSNRAWEHLRQMSAIGPRPAGSPAIGETRQYIKAQLAAAGVNVVEQAWDEQTPAGMTHMVNLVATIPGGRADRIVISGHYDTKLFRNLRFVGANDGGSSAAFLVELARVLKARRNAFTIELLFLDGEEAVCLNWDDCARPNAPDNTYGSRHYVAVGKQRGTLASMRLSAREMPACTTQPSCGRGSRMGASVPNSTRPAPSSRTSSSMAPLVTAV